MATTLSEFDLIRRFFAPLTYNFSGARGLKDDAAIVSVAPGNELVVTCDSIVEGIHFRYEDGPEDIAARGLRVNLSDLAAMGAKPMAYLMALSLPSAMSEDWWQRFVSQLSVDQSNFGISLVGGDTVLTTGPLTLTVTAIGQVKIGKALTRDGAQIGDRIFVTGNIGDASLGLKILKGELSEIPKTESENLVRSFLRPEPRVTLGQSLVDIANAVVDVSDGLVADIGHICRGSNLGARINIESIPFSPCVVSHLKFQPNMVLALITAGDDYELAFTAPAGARKQLERLAGDMGVRMADIGEVIKAPGVILVDSIGEQIELEGDGYRHF